ncbi:hypothetical protein OIE90_33475 (plasmid) [Streptomyces cellulosae]|uniref:tRNA adenosine deaminase-associated protein n=1 Tax=Streptomyces cellulosae TaxID=1968 RepID=UPI002ED044C6|nr:hypothetical protein OG880_33045 [Streptomyces cellulosae]WTB73749.1 hypothetical protein OIE90_33475 [Streptomyces cellulosae]
MRASLRVSNSAREFYFAALLARSEEGWEASDVDLDDVETMDDLVSAAREVAVADHPVLLFIEQEDRWFSVVRLNDAQTPRIYVSDAASAADSSCGVLLLTELLGREHPSSMVGPAHGPVGDTAVLEDLGVPPADLLSLDVDALADLAEALETAANLSGLPRHP